MPTNTNETQIVTDVSDKTIAYIDPTIINQNKIAIDLIGEDISEMATTINDNFIKLMQTFYGESAPINPLDGQMWFNKNDNITYRYLNDSWNQVERDNTYDSFMYVMYDIEDVTEFVLDEFVFNFTIENIKLYNQEMRDVKFIIDPFDSRKIILKETNVTTLYILVFHPKDRITNPYKNRRVEYFTESNQTQFDIETFLNGSNVNTLTVDLNGVRLKNDEFSVSNNVVTIDGMIYRVRPNDKLTVWTHGGSLSSYYSNLHITVNARKDFLRLPKIFKDLDNIEIINKDDDTAINPIAIGEFDDYYHFEFLDRRLITANVKLRII